MTKYLGYDDSQVKEEKEKIMHDLSYVIQMLDAMAIDKEKAIDLLFGDSITNDEKLRMIANGGEIGEPIIDEEDTKEEIVEE
jgi:mannitol/fructose-specific phosphotransferase system IIA component